MLKKDNKRLLMMGIILVVFILIIFIIYWFVNLSTQLDYDKIEERMASAAKNYWQDHADAIDLASGEEHIISVARLEDGYMREFSSMIPKDVHCQAEVKVSKMKEYVAFYPYLDCGTYYQTKSLYQRVIETQEIVESGPGLYEVRNELIFRGSEVNNYVSFADREWRIMAIDEDHNIKLISLLREPETVWDDRYNIESGFNAGINLFVSEDTENSIIKKKLDEIIFEDYYVSEDQMGKLVYMDICVGDRLLDETSKSGRIECREVAGNQVFSLISAYEYLRISLDENCINTTSSACQNYNYLSGGRNRWWTVTARAESNDRVYYINPTVLSTRITNRLARIRPVITLNANVISFTGDGTIDNPYKVN